MGPICGFQSVGTMRWYQNVVISAWVSVCGFPSVGIRVWVSVCRSDYLGIWPFGSHQAYQMFEFQAGGGHQA